ncbi:MAG: translation elongation factor G [Deltaproteobacteria bacterium RBG_19FT_COMBO_46_12]|nr:MAG: translation elongation factor G [Deltaproteobacteria bacterium RBG_19FT_COMBO_46_12]
MKRVEPTHIRNIGTFGHGGEGKTSLVEAILFDTGENTRLGRVDDGSSLMDFEPEEINRKITISSAISHFEWNKHQFHVIDTPGYANFIAEAKASMRIVDGAVIVIGGNSEVKVHTETVWGYANEFQTPRILYVSKMDMERADYFKVVEEVKKVFPSQPAVAVQLPIGGEGSFKGVVDLIQRKAYYYREDGSGKFEVKDVPSDMKEEVERLREKLVEAVVEMDDQLMEKYLESGEVSTEEVIQCLRKGTIERKLVPAVCGSSTRNIGIQPLLDIAITCFPSPLEKGSVQGKNVKTGEVETREPKEDAPFSAFIFKTIADPFAGKLNLFRVYSGSVNADSTLYNSKKDVRERIGQIFLLEGKKQKPIGFAGVGDIVAVAKLKETTTGDTFSDEKKPIIFEETKLPLPMISYALTPKSKGDEEKIAASLARIHEEDPTMMVGRDEQTGEILLSGVGQTHVEVIVEKLKRKFGVEVNLSVPKVPYKETIRGSKTGVVYRHKKQTGGRGQFAEVHFDVSALPRGTGFEFENALTGMNVPRNFVPAVEKGIGEAMQSGVLAGFPVVDVKVRFYDGKSHEVDSSEMAFKIAAIMAFKKGVQEASPVLLEPVMKVVVTAPDENIGDVIGDLNSRRGRVLRVDAKGNYQMIEANVPMSEMLKYAPDLNSKTGGRGTFTMEFSHYEELPAQLAEKVIVQIKKDKEKES